MKKQSIITSFLLWAVLVFSATAGMAQKDTTRLRQEVEVTKAYQPTIPEAVKINEIPKIKNEPAETPTFDYSIYSKPVFSTFDPTPVAAAKMVGDPRPEMKNGLLKIGLGNYLTPYGELFFNAQPGKKGNFGMHFKHLSSSGKLKLLNEDKVSAPQSENLAEIFGQHFFRRSTFSGSLSYDRKALTYYGYAGDLLTDDQKDQMIPYFGDRQYFSKGAGSIRLKSETMAKYDFNYDFGARYHYLISKTGQTEKQAEISGELSKKIDSALGLLDFSVIHYQIDSIWNDAINAFGRNRQFILEANPSFTWETRTASIQLGLNTALEFEKDAPNEFYIWPKIKAEWSPVERVLTLFAGVDGHLKHNSYSAIAEENPYVDPYHNIQNANYKYIFSGGLKGKLTQKTNYVAQASYSVVEDQHFYLIKGFEAFNPIYPTPKLENTFSWEYDDVNVLKLSGEVLHPVSENFSLHLMGNYYAYKLKEQAEAWQMPVYELLFSGVYRPSQQLKFTTDIFVSGGRKGLVLDSKWQDPLSNSVNVPEKIAFGMDPVIDLNAGAEYQFSNKLNFFVKLNNFGFQKYEQWLGYTNRGFNWLTGLSYSF